MIQGVCGNVGCGKTLMLAQVIALENEDSEIYSNLKFKGKKIKSLTSEDDFKNIKQNDKNKLIVIDELHMMADSWDYNEVAKTLALFGTQHRKLTQGGYCNVWFSTQHFGQIINRLRNLTTHVFLPRIAGYWEDKPALLNLDICKSNLYGDIVKSGELKMPLITLDGKLTCDLYDTYQIIDNLEDSNSILIPKLLNKYNDFTGKKTHLKSILVLEEGISTTLAQTIANYIIH